VKLTAEGAGARSVWSRVLADDPTANVSPAWMDCVCASGQWKDVTRAYLADDGRELVLPLARLRRTAAAFPVDASMPFGWGAGGLLCPDGRLFPSDVAAVAHDLSGWRAIRTTVRPSPGMDEVWAAGVPAQVARTHHMSQSLELAGDFGEVWSSRFSRSLRRNIGRAERRPITVEWEAGARLVPVFDALYRISVTRWAKRQHEPPALAQWRARRRDPRSKFEVVAQRLGAACRIGVAWHSGAPAAAIVVLAHGEHSTYWRGAMDLEVVADTGANHLLHRMAIEEACNAGRRWYHMGDSAPSSPLAEFKRRYGAEEEHYAGYRFERMPLTGTEDLMRRGVKRALRFRD
jgi:hypothetical protein